MPFSLLSKQPPPRMSFCRTRYDNLRIALKDVPFVKRPVSCGSVHAYSGVSTPGSTFFGGVGQPRVRPRSHMRGKPSHHNQKWCVNIRGYMFFSGLSWVLIINTMYYFAPPPSQRLLSLVFMVFSGLCVGCVFLWCPVLCWRLPGPVARWMAVRTDNGKISESPGPLEMTSGCKDAKMCHAAFSKVGRLGVGWVRLCLARWGGVGCGGVLLGQRTVFSMGQPITQPLLTPR